MRRSFHVPRSLGGILAALFTFSSLQAQVTNTTVRVMSANLNGNTQSYQPFAIRIFQGLKPDIVAIQEFNYSNNTPSDFRAMLDTAFATNFVYFRENGYTIPNGIISRYPIIAAGSWDDAAVNDRGFAWAQIALPGTNNLFVVSVHLYSGGTATDRDSEATAIKSHIQTDFPPGACVVVAGDLNVDSRSEAAVTTFKTFLSDSPVPTDAQTGGDPDTNEPRNKPYDYVLPSFSFTNLLTASVFPSHSFSNGAGI
jgi:endonuclease/exonuclease/phosphatase family metal-dependent hydrolase